MFRISKRGQVTIPQALRERFGLLPHTEVEFVDRNGKLVLIKNSHDRQSRLRALRGSDQESSEYRRDYGIFARLMHMKDWMVDTNVVMDLF